MADADQAGDSRAHTNAFSIGFARRQRGSAETASRLNVINQQSASVFFPSLNLPTMSAPGSSSESTLASQSSASAPAPKMDAAAADKEVANRDMAFDRVDRDERDNEALEREAREVERKLAFWGADAPPQRPARRRASSMPRRPALGVLHAATTGGPAMRPGATSETGAITARGARATRRRALSGTSERPSFPELHLVDSAYDREVQLLRDRGFNVPAQRMRSRSMSMKSTGRKTFDERTMDERTVVEEPEEEEEQDAQREDPNRVQWPPGDPANPQNWPTWRKWSVTVLCGLLTINVCVQKRLISLTVC